MPKSIKFIIILVFLSFSLPKTQAEEILSWQDCVREAKAKNPDLVSAQEKLNQTKADKAIAKSKLFPQVDLSNEYAYKTATSKASETRAVTHDYTYFKLTGKQLAFDGFKVSNKVAEALENIKSSEYGYMVTSSNLRLDLRRAFVELLRAQELLKITEEIAKRRRDNLILVTLNYESGRENKGSLLTIQADLEESKLEVLQAQRLIQSAQVKLCKRLGRIEVAPVKTQGDFIVASLNRQRPDFDALTKANPLLKEIIAKKQAAVFNLKSAKADFFPSIYANASRERDHIGKPRDNTSEWSVGGSLSFPIFEGGLRIAEVSRARALYEQLVADERSTGNNVTVTLAEKWKALQDFMDEVKTRQIILEAAQERAKITQLQYSMGLVSFNDWIIIEDALINAKKIFLDVRSSLLIAEAEWVQAKGGTLDYEE
jgi:outer membrane protein TolC